MLEYESQSIQAARAGDQQAFRRLVQAHTRPLFCVCVRILGDAASAEDALQDAFLSAWRGLDRFDQRSAFGSWLHRIAVNAALTHLRKRRPELPLDDFDDDMPSETPPMLDGDPFEHAAGMQFGQQLTTQLESLSVAERSAFVLRHFEHYPLDEIASVLGSNVNACKQAIFRAVRKLRLALAPIRSDS
ncbi:MAG: RNA polymerase sigma factor [Pseudomarimonas sp.]